MRLLIVLLLVASCKSSTSLGIFNREAVGTGPNFRTDKEFYNRIGDWYGHAKARIYERLFGTTTEAPPSPSVSEVLNLGKLELQKRLRNRERFLLDLSTLTFDTDEDWGFRIGNWYFIRKGYSKRDGSINNDSDEWDMQPWTTTKPTYPNTEHRDSSTINVDDLKYPETTKPSSITQATEATTAPTVGMQSTMQQTDTQQPTAETTTQIDSFEGLATGMEKRIEDNEANSDLFHKGSVEVFMI